MPLPLVCGDPAFLCDIERGNDAAAWVYMRDMDDRGAGKHTLPREILGIDLLLEKKVRA